ncbi:tyrosine-type recombinase/integrase [Nocardiopsis potens]|uniref:tyrosine-type recombinase/integrase n=1 Tax=Nocardiopsis potens TaxID=1246458 RepID=UPI00034AC51D|nr:tyrosine-type recombinase/integrase [Nocardiopsis potens]
MSELVPAASTPALPEGADGELSASAAERIAAAWRPSTRTGYARDWGRFASWCAAAGRTALPATAETLASYADHLADQGMAPASIDRALGAVSSHTEAVTGTKAPMKAARLVLRAYRNERAENGLSAARRAPALSVAQLRRMLAAAGDDLVGLRDRALLLLGYAMMARRSELARLDVADAAEVDDGLEVFVAVSKTDKDAVGASVPVPYGTHRLTCPVRTVRAYTAALAEHGVADGPLLRSVDRHGRLAGTPGASGRGTGRMSGAGINLVVKRLAEAAGVEGEVTAHSLRAGAATAAAASGAGRAWIARQGRWSERSTAVDTYIRPAEMWANHPLRHIGL